MGTGVPARPGRAQARQVFERILRLPVPLLDPKIFLKLLQLDLNAHPPGAPIVKIHLLAEPVRPRATQSGLFLPPSPEPEKLELTLARIAGIVGENKVGIAAIAATHTVQRDSSCNVSRPTVAETNVANQRHVQQRSGADPNLQTAENAVTALRIFRPPARATVTVDEGRPTRIVCPKRKEICGEILWAAGPWRTSGDWWEQEGGRTTSGISLYRKPAASRFTAWSAIRSRAVAGGGKL